MANWVKCAHVAEDVFGCFVDWDERFFICPECDEPIYECDWVEADFNPEGGPYVGRLVCPVCEADLWEEE